MATKQQQRRGRNQSSRRPADSAKPKSNGTANQTTPQADEAAQKASVGIKTRRQYTLPELPVTLGVSADGIINLDSGDLIEWGAARQLITVAREANAKKAKIARIAKKETTLKEQRARLSKAVKSIDEQLAELAQAVEQGTLTFDQAVKKADKVKATHLGDK